MKFYKKNAKIIHIMTFAIGLISSAAIISAVITSESGKLYLDKEHQIEAVLEIPKYPINENGETFGSSCGVTSENEPDLILVCGDNGYEGYCRKTDLDEKVPSSPEEAVNIMKEKEKNKKENKENMRVIPVYDVNGKNIIDTFTIGKSDVEIIYFD